jgi:succinoglycan biosynthesis transport protein ExoP
MSSVYNNKPRILPAAASAPLLTYAPPPSSQEPEELLSMHHYLWLLRRAWWKIALAVAICTVLTAALCFVVTPVYEATARITVDNKVPTAMLGQDAAAQNTSDVEEFLNTEMDLIQSDSVLRPVAEKFHLLKSKHGDGLPSGPVALKNLTVTHPTNSLLLRITYRSKSPEEAADVANAVAHSYIDQVTETRVRSSMNVSGFMEQQLDDLKANMNKSAEALSAYERELGVVDPEAQTTMLAARVLQLNTDYTEAENNRIQKQAAYKGVSTGNLASIEISTQADQLAKLQEKVQTAQQEMATLKSTYGPNYPQYRVGANNLAELERQYAAARADIGKRIQTDYTQAASHEGMLRDALAQAKAEADRLNASSVQYQQLKRDADANKTLYNELFQKIKEAGINAGFQNSAIRIADEARPEASPVFPKKSIFTFLGFFLSLVFSVAAVLIADMLDKSVRDPAQARRSLNIEVLGVLPDVHQLKPAGRQLLLDDGATVPALKSTGRKLPLVDWSRSQDAYTEAIRTMRSLVLLERSREPLRSLLVTSALAGEGKSTCTAHLAIAHAMQGRKTLLIDADLRRPSQHSHFALPNEAGLAEIILEDRSIADVRHTVSGIDNLHVVTAGALFQKGAHLVGTRIANLLAEAAKDYDLVLVDAPPMLGLAEPIQIACATDGVLLIAQAGQTNQEAVAAALGTLQRLNVHVLGLVLNKVRRDMSSGYQHYGVYAQYNEPVRSAS